MSDQTSPAPFQHLDEETLQLVARNLRGVQSARLRFFRTDRELEQELIALFLALEIPTETERIERMAPPPRRRFSFQFRGDEAVITVAPDQPLTG